MSATLSGAKHDYGKLVRWASTASVVTASTLILIKTGAWFATNSVSVLASLVDSLMDVAASLVNLFALRYALRPPDEDHRFGHGKAESLAGLGQAAFIAGSALFLLLNAADRFINPREIEETAIGVGVMFVGIVMTGGLLAFQRYVVLRTGSLAVRADALHYRTDLLANLATLIVLLAASAGYDLLDPVLASIIAFYVLYSAWQIGFSAVHTLMDRELDANVHQQIQGLALETPGVLGVHDLRTRQAGQRVMVQLHLDMDKDWTLDQAHTVTKTVEYKIRALFADSDIIIHQDPVPGRPAGRS